VAILRPALALLRPYRRDVAVAFLTLFGSLAAVLAGPALVSYAINHGLVHHHDFRVVEIAGGAYLLVAIAFYVFTHVQTQMLSGTGERVLNDLRKRVFGHLLAQPLEFFDAESSAQLLSRVTADIDVLESLVQSGIGSFLTSVGLFVASLVVLVIMSPLLFVVTIVCLIPVVLASLGYRVTSTRAYTAVRLRVGETLATLDEGLAGVRVVQAFRQEQRMDAVFRRSNDAQFEANMDTVRLSTHFFPKVEGSGVVTTVALLLVGSVLVRHHLTSVGAVAAFILYTANLFGAVVSVSQLFDLLQSSGAAMGTVFTLLEVKPTMVDPLDTVALPRRGVLQLDGVSFAYRSRDERFQGGIALDSGPRRHEGHDELVLRDIELRIEEGEHLVLVGPTGAGKSTLAKLIGRLYDPTTGAVRFGGVDLRQAGLAQLRRRIVVVPQEGFLFRGSVLDNIRIGRADATESEVKTVLRRLGAEQRLLGMDGGLQAEVGERGSRLSAGERQLVSLARAALSDPAILVLDEATSSLDPGTELVVERALAVVSAERTVVTVAHRLTTAERADRVGVVVDGRLIEVGSHQALVAAGGHYAGLHAAWVAGTSAA
jgi:ATP-binding cassette subfamily B protein